MSLFFKFRSGGSREKPKLKVETLAPVPPPAGPPSGPASAASAVPERGRSFVRLLVARVVCRPQSVESQAQFSAHSRGVALRSAGAVQAVSAGGCSVHCEGLPTAAGGGTDRRHHLEEQRVRVRRRRRGALRHGVRGGGGGRGGLPRACRALAHRALARQVRAARQLQRQGRGEGAAREVPHGEVRQPPDGADPQAARRRDVALRRAAEALRALASGRRGRGRGCRAGGGGGRGRAARHGLGRGPARTPRETISGRQKTIRRCKCEYNILCILWY